MDLDLLNITEKPVFDDSIVSQELHSYNPYVNSYDYGDEIRICINQQDLYLRPCDSFIFIRGQVVAEKDKPDGYVRPNFGAYLFEEIRYELNGIEVDRCKNPGVTSMIKNYLSYNSIEGKALEVSGWWNPLESAFDMVDNDYRFELSIPLKMLLGVMEDYKKIIANCRHELVFIRSRNDSNTLLKKTKDSSNISIQINKIQWKVPHITVNDFYKVKLLKHLEHGTWISIPYRNWDLYEYPILPTTTTHTWNVRSTSQLEKPRFVILGFQTNKKDADIQNKYAFDHCKIQTAKLYLNSESYPYDDLQINFPSGHYAQLYNMYTSFQHSYYNRTPSPLFTYKQFKSISPLIVFDTTRQNDTLKNGAVDIRLEWKFSENTPPKTSAYCLILHDKVIEYNALTNLVRQIQ